VPEAALVLSRIRLDADRGAPAGNPQRQDAVGPVEPRPVRQPAGIIAERQGLPALPDPTSDVIELVPRESA
jgi:hypothetical protein